MATPIGIQKAAVEALTTALPGLGTCALYAGEFSGGEISRSSVTAPAALVACLGVTREGAVECGQADWRCRFTVYCMTRHAGGRSPRAAEALELAESAVAAIEGNRFGLTGLFPAQVVRMDNLYAESFDRAGVALWAVTWEQVARLGADEWAAEGTRPESLYVGIAPEVGLPHKDDYELVYAEEHPDGYEDPEEGGVDPEEGA